MRKGQKNEILEIMENFPEIHSEICNTINQGNVAVAIRLLLECQEYAVSLKETIKEVEGKETSAEVRFNEYGELLAAAVQKLQEKGKCEDESIFVQLDNAIAAVAESIERDIPIRKEIAFFPYKASMWDSLESVYLAAKEDENCDVYCVPIPYLDKNSDGSFREMHYEGMEYPSYVEVTDWQSYNFEERRPDVIYIHNPYDGWNFVTSVHPRFYAKNLKNYTDKLVYIPYFVLEEIEPYNQGKIEQMKHFCFLPGIIYADQVIIQSENMRQIYINEYMKAAKEQNFPADRKALEDKIQGYGSPKFDKVLNTKKEELQIPVEWRKIIEKSDGSRKKIILYNTSLNALLEKNEKMLEKMKAVFRVFKVYQDEVALLWRPHPLMQSTIKSMRPHLWTDYEKIVNEYRAEGWGIYDDTADLERAVLISDMYYGDRSSVVQVYEKTGKPVFVNEAVGILFKELGAAGLLNSMGVSTLKYNASARKEEIEKSLPESWKQKIYTINEQGQRVPKKIVLYSPTLEEIINNNEMVADKLRYVLRTVEENPQVVLWWFGFSLTDSAVDMIRKRLPGVIEEYEKLITEYKESGLGIYDDSCDATRAIMLSDAYYGDQGELYSYYKETGKMIMCQNYEVVV